MSKCSIHGFRKATHRFKALVRKVINNLFWLQDDVDEQLGVNVARNVQLLTKKKKPGSKYDLKLKAKSILSKPPMYRTDEDLTLLETAFRNLKCFKTYSSSIRRKLAKVLHYKYYKAGRTIIREHHVSYAIYFILTGTVSISLSHMSAFNETLNTNVGFMEAGTMFGEVGLLYNTARTSTIATFTQCEFLVLDRSYFDLDIRLSIKKRWDKVLQAVRQVSYFQQWSEKIIRECCTISKRLTFETDETILGDRAGFTNCVYFVLKGRCRVIEHLSVVPYYTNGIKSYKLIKVEKTFASRTNYLQKYRKSERGSEHTILGSQESIDILNIMENNKASEQIQQNPPKISINPRPSIYYSLTNLYSRRQIETKFMQVCILSEMACFGIGEYMQNRRIVAVTDVDCLVVPRNWLFQKSTSNVWARIQQYLNAHIPNTEKIFNHFISQRKWRSHKKQLVEKLVADKCKVNCISNVPYSIRILQDYDFIE